MTQFQRQAIERAARVWPSLNEAAVLDEARRATGLSDFGASDFRERLRLWLSCIEQDEGLGPLGRLGLYNDCVRAATNRLRVEHLLREHSEILSVSIDRPLIITGLPRSGTTHLVNVIATDPRLRSMPLWEGMEPVPAPGEAAAKGGEDPRQVRTRELWTQFEELLPYMPAMHEMAADHVHEDIELQTIDFSSYNIEWTCRAHSWRDWYLTHDRAPHYRYARKVLQALSWFRGPERWLMKSPQHLENLVPLIQTYPDATVVITHRDPIAVIQSILTMLAYGDRLRRARIDLAELAAYWIERVEVLLRACVRDRSAVSPGRSIDVLFHEYVADTGKTLRRIYDLAELELDDASKARIDVYLHSHPRGQHGQVVYDLEGDFAVDVKALRERFHFYYERFPVKQERVAGEKS